MSVRYKFKNTLSNYDTVSFDGVFISLRDFKKTVVQQKHLSKIDDDLKVVNSETKQEFKDEDDEIPKNTTLIVSRIPRTPQSKKSQFDKRTMAAKNANGTNKDSEEALDKGILIDLSKLNISEEQKIEVMMEQSTAAYNPKTYQVITYKGPAPRNYRCSRCYETGHWIKDCPIVAMNRLRINENRRKAGIPRTFLQKGCETEKENKPFSEALVVEKKTVEVPADLKCSICKEIFVDAVMTPCCGCTFCDECVRSALLESTANDCPSCKESDLLPDSLIPNRYLRNSVNAFHAKYRTAPVGIVNPGKIKKEVKAERAVTNNVDKK